MTRWLNPIKAEIWIIISGVEIRFHTKNLMRNLVSNPMSCNPIKLETEQLPNSLISDKFKFVTISPLCCWRKSTPWPCNSLAGKGKVPRLHKQGSWEDWWGNVWHRSASSNLPPTMHLDTLFYAPSRRWCLTLQMNAMNNWCHLSKKENKESHY